MASQGSRNSLRWLHSSQTEHVLQNTEIPLLVTRFEATEPFTECDRALAIIQDEHRSMAVVLWGLLDWVEHTHQPADAADLESLELMLGYLQSFPLQQHHPKEERYLHQRLRQRAPECEALLAEIESEHDQHKVMIGDVCQLLRDASSKQTPVDQDLVASLKTFAEDAWRHIRHEEMAVLPLARARLLEGDWTEIAEVFEGRGDPDLRVQAAEDFRRQFARIANRSTPPARTLR